MHEKGMKRFRGPFAHPHPNPLPSRERAFFYLLARSLVIGIFFVVAVSATACRGTSSVTSDTMKDEGANQIVAPHFVDSAPSHEQVFRQAPEAIVVNFNFTLSEQSAISVSRNGTKVPLGTATFDANQLTIRASLGANAGEGSYDVSYKACWPDGSCHDGKFSFRVDPQLAGYQDVTGQAEVMVDMKDLKFSPANLIISKGTKVTWTNLESAVHFVNSDPHPSHNALKELNSLDLSQDDTYSYTFTQPGEWAYHCSAHYPAGMVGHIVVE